jgi:hypothetical protein
MKNLQNKIASLAEYRIVVPLVLFVITILAYGLSFWRLGFYWDDQPISWIRYQLGRDAVTRYFADSRPVWAWLYQLTAYIIPLKPAYWQLFAMFWRWAGIYAFWLVAAELFPRRKDIAFSLSLFMLLYPGFNQQWVSYVYAHFFIVLFFLLISWHLMFRRKTIPAMIFSGLHLLMFEYFFLLEFMRPVLLFMSLRDEPLSNRERYTKVFKEWLPYIAVIIFVMFYRLGIYSHPGFGYSLTDEIAKAPMETITQLVLHIFSSIWTATVGAWIQVFQFPGPKVDGLRTSIVYVVVLLAVGVLAWLKLLKEKQITKTSYDAYWLLGLGVIMLGLGGVPYWLTNLPVSLSFPANRALLSFMFGSCFFLLGLIELLPARLKYACAVLLIALSAGRQFLWSVDYLRDWQSQENLFWQMTWRAPGLEKNTIVLINEELTYYADNSLSAMLNWIYGPDEHDNVIDYALFYPTNRESLSLQKDVRVVYPFLAGRFIGNTSQAVVFYYAPPKCLRVLDPEIDSINRLIPDESLLREAALLSSTMPILSQQTSKMPDMYGPEPVHNWCYYFQKADLARQLGDWESVTHLGDDAFALDDYPNDPVERFVYIEGYAHHGDWQKAVEYSIASYKVSKNYVGPLLCILWDRIERETAASAEQRSALTDVRNKFECLP